MTHPLTLVAHRGLPERYPENSLAGVRAALLAGAKYIEVDIQLSSDRVPFLYHDENMIRMSGVSQSIIQTSSKLISSLSIAYPAASSYPEKTESIATLQQLVELITEWPDRQFFLELKRQSVEQHGVLVCAQEILSTIKKVRNCCIPISFRADAVRKFQQLSDIPVGWVVREWDKQHHALANTLSPDFLFCNVNKIPEDRSKLWQGAWQWVLYTVNEVQHIHELHQAGFSLIETNLFDEVQAQL